MVALIARQAYGWREGSLRPQPARRHRLLEDPFPQGRTRAEEVERAIGLGATLVADHTRPDGGGWVTLADPEGNEFCVERGESG